MFYRYAGTVAELADGKTLSHGDVIELSEEAARALIEQRVAIVPHEQPAAAPPEE